MSAKATIGSINIDKLDSGCVVRVEVRTPDEESYNGYRSTTKSYIADDGLLDQIAKYVDAKIEADLVEEAVGEKGKSRLVDSNKFLGKTTDK